MSWHSCPRRVNAGNKNAPSMHHPQRQNVATSMVGFDKGCKRRSSPKTVNPRDIAGNAEEEEECKAGDEAVSCGMGPPQALIWSKFEGVPSILSPTTREIFVRITAWELRLYLVCPYFVCRDKLDRSKAQDFIIQDLKGETVGRMPGTVNGEQMIIQNCQVTGGVVCLPLLDQQVL